MRLISTFIFIGLVVSYQTKSQCTPPVPIPVIACGTGTPLANGVTINTGETYFFNGVGGSFSNITINGGTLLLCGSVTLTNTNFTSGRLVVNAGASATFGGSFNTGSNNNFFNSGTVTFNANVNVQGTNTFVYNAAGATINATSPITVFNNGLFINNGTATGNDIILNSGAQVCLGPGSISQTANITSNQTNAVTAPGGVACVSYSNSFMGNNPITATSNVHICQLAGASNPVPVVVGAAVVSNPCVSCSALLPLKLLSFKGRQLSGQAELEWITTWEENVESFIIERSKDGVAFENIGTVKARNQPSTYQFSTPLATDGYFRLKMADLDGRFTYSSIVKLKAILTGLQLTVLSNPVTKSYADISIAVNKVQQGNLLMVDNMGRPIRKIPLNLTSGVNNYRIDLNGVSPGNYYLYFNGKPERSATVQLVKL
jgi:hypothetical protein